MTRLRIAIAIAVMGIFIAAPIHHHRELFGHTPDAMAATSCGFCLLHGKIVAEVGQTAVLRPVGMTGVVPIVSYVPLQDPELVTLSTRAPPAV